MKASISCVMFATALMVSILVVGLIGSVANANQPCPCAEQGFKPLAPPNTASPELGVVLVDLESKQSKRFYCVPAEKLERPVLKENVK